MITADALTEYRPLVERIGQNVRRLREAQGLSQTDAGLGFGLSQQTWSRIERGEYAVNIVTLARVADALGVEIQDLVG